MHTILVIDDEPQIVQDVLLNYGYETTIAKDGYSGMQILLSSAERFDLVILDLQLPKMDGWAVLKAIREGEDCPNIPVIMLTSADTEQSRMAGLRRGADIYLTKPITPGVLLAQLEALLRRTKWDSLATDDSRNDGGHKTDNLLTQREIEILHYVVQGLSNLEIGEKLTITETTVKNHLGNIYKKMEVSNRNQAAFMAQKLKLL
jgi:DNA-binding NarL/FixJ family response regulator